MPINFKLKVIKNADKFIPFDIYNTESYTGKLNYYIKDDNYVYCKFNSYSSNIRTWNDEIFSFFELIVNNKSLALLNIRKGLEHNYKQAIIENVLKGVIFEIEKV
jgi:hypothetical protein